MCFMCKSLGHNWVRALELGAGAGKFGLPLADITPEQWAFHMDLNLNSVLHLTQLFIPLLEASAPLPTKKCKSRHCAHGTHYEDSTLCPVEHNNDVQPCRNMLCGIENLGLPMATLVETVAGHVCSLAGGVCVQASKGSIVNISSIASQRPGKGAAAYCVSKAAVDMLTKASALELAPKVSLVVPLGT